MAPKTSGVCVQPVDNVRQPFRGESGVQSYDTIAWSARPILQPYATEGLPIQAVRCLGAEASGSVQAVSDVRRKHWDALLLSYIGPGRSESRVSGTRVSATSAHRVLLFMPTDADSLLEFPATSASIAFHMPPNYLESFVDQDQGRRLPPLITACPDAVGRIMGMIEREIARPGFDSRLKIECLFRELAILLAARDTVLPSPVAGRIVIAPARMQRVLDFVEANLGTAIGLSDMAAVAGLSVFHFARAFKLTSGLSPYHYVRLRRMALAHRLLATRDLPLVEIARACGFATQAHFTAAFTRSGGLSPGQYRRVTRRDTLRR